MAGIGRGNRRRPYLLPHAITHTTLQTYFITLFRSRSRSRDREVKRKTEFNRDRGMDSRNDSRKHIRSYSGRGDAPVLNARDDGRARYSSKVARREQEDGEHDSGEELDENKKKELENFIQNIEGDDDGFIGFGMDDEEEAQRIIAESKKKREEILKKFNQNDGNVDFNKTNKSHDTTTQSQEVTSQTLLASEGIAAMVIVEEENINSKVMKNQSQNNDEKMQEELERERLAILAEAQESKVTNDFDMFSASPADAIPAVYSGKVALKSQLLEGEDHHLQSNWDDGEGYYKTRIGEVICNKYQALGVVGKGVFSTVLKCVDVQKSQTSNSPGVSTSDATNDNVVALKLIRNNETMRKAAEKEKSILSEISMNDVENKRHCVRLIECLDYRNHVVFVFEYQQMNLREALKKFGKDVGINIGAIRIYARQLFIALRHLSDLKIVHADLKLDNILCSGDLKQVKLCDFGSAFRETDTDNDPTPYLVSRFYRAPEIILGLPYDRAIDTWSVAVCLYELFTGHVMFAGRINNEMLKLHMELKGKLTNKQIKAHIRSYEQMHIEPFFDGEMRFKYFDINLPNGKNNIRILEVNQPTKDLASILRSAKAGGDDSKLVNALIDLLDKALVLDPAKRLTPTEALQHTFFSKII